MVRFLQLAAVAVPVASTLEALNDGEVVSLLQTQAVFKHNATDAPTIRPCGSNRYCKHSDMTWKDSENGFKPPNCFKTMFSLKPYTPAGEQNQHPSVPPFTQQSGQYYPYHLGECYGVIQPDSVDRFNNELAKFGCVAGAPHNGFGYLFQKWTPDSAEGGVWSASGGNWPSEEACRKAAEKSTKCAGANVYTYVPNSQPDPASGGKCFCSAGVTTLQNGNPGYSLTCGLKSLPATQNSQPGSSRSGVNMLASWKQSKTLTSCSKGWGYSGVYIALPYLLPKTSPHRGLGVQNIMERDGRIPEYKTWIPARTESKVWTEQFGWAKPSAHRTPSECAEAIHEQSKDPSDLCFGAKGAYMTTEYTKTVNRCGCFFGDPSELISIGPYDDGKFNDIEAPHAAAHAVRAQGIIFCLTDGGDYTGGQEYLKGAPSSGVYDPDGPKPSVKPILTPEELAKCKGAKKNRKLLKDAYKKAKADHKEKKAAAKAAKLAKKAAKEAMLANLDVVENCNR